MERRGEEEELNKLLDEIPIAMSPSFVSNNRSSQYLQRQMMLCGNGNGNGNGNINNAINNTINNNVAFSSGIQNPLLLGTIPDQSLESALARLSLSSTPHQSHFYPPPAPPSLGGDVPGVPLLENSAVLDPFMGQGFQSLSYHQLQQTAMEVELQRLKVQGAIAAAFLRARAESYPVPGLNPIATSDEHRREFFNGVGGLVPSGAASINGCGKSCCRHQPRNNGRLQLPKPPSREQTKRFPMTPCFNRNGFRLDSDGHCRVAAPDGQVLETENLISLRSPFFNQSLQHLQQLPNYSSLEDLRGRMVAVAKDQHGCRFLQKKFEEGRIEEIEMIFAEVKDHVDELMVHPFGNYLVQKLSEICTEEQKLEIVHTITKEEFQLVTICLNSHGTRAVQKLLEHLNTPEQISCLMLALRPGTVILTKDANGHHVIQHCLQRFSNEDNKYLMHTIADHCVEIATDSSGCCVMQHCLAHALGEPRERLLAEVTANALVLSQDPYGNYVVQYILGLKIPHVNAAVSRQLEGSYISLSLQKFSSHVVEKCLRESEEEQSTRIIKELLSSSKFVSLLEDAYGNYVVQSALLVSKGDTYDAMVGIVENHIPSMRSNPYGKRILDRIKAKR
ncbi:putative pumilio homolog 8, chloroplastic [Macadamia integrifolia]|uniref:putative pumilio homolog 8, chloroplastic n=1 Tax=Macadamia integrifolia TaxID=60698 RepID=UPI001C4E3388|nr:putative pumilio homolog 8, chloroplastic [Macadamia integrifolia]